MLNIQHVIKVSVLEACPNMVIKLASYNSVSTEFTFPRGENELNSIVGQQTQVELGRLGSYMNEFQRYWFNYFCQNHNATLLAANARANFCKRILICFTFKFRNKINLPQSLIHCPHRWGLLQQYNILNIGYEYGIKFSFNSFIGLLNIIYLLRKLL